MSCSICSAVGLVQQICTSTLLFPGSTDIMLIYLASKLQTPFAILNLVFVFPFPTDDLKSKSKEKTKGMVLPTLNNLEIFVAQFQSYFLRIADLKTEIRNDSQSTQKKFLNSRSKLQKTEKKYHILGRINYSFLNFAQACNS